MKSCVTEGKSLEQKDRTEQKESLTLTDFQEKIATIKILCFMFMFQSLEEIT